MLQKLQMLALSPLIPTDMAPVLLGLVATAYCIRIVCNILLRLVTVVVRASNFTSIGSGAPGDVAGAVNTDALAP